MSLLIHIDSKGWQGVPGTLYHIGRGVLVASGSSFQVHWGVPEVTESAVQVAWGVQLVLG
jgi:hypothetical protein